MNFNSVAFGQRAIQILSHLVEDIGPRPAGSAAETRALDYIEEQFNHPIFKIARFPVRYQPEPAFFPYYSLAAIGFLAVGLLFPFYGWTSLILPALVYILPEAAIWLQGHFLPYKDGSSNLLVTMGSEELEETDIILCAHIDTARAIPRGPRVWQKWRAEILFTMMRVAILLTILGLLQLSAFELPAIVQTFAQILSFSIALLLVAQDFWEQVGSIGKFTQGANDNASGTALLTAFAQSITEEPPAHLKVGFLFTGSEECGLHGARQFAGELTKRNLRPLVVSVDMVGAGSQLRIITQCGTLFPVKTNPEVNELLKRADPLAEFHAAPRRWGDFAPFSKAGIPAGHMENTGTPLSWETYHTSDDNLDVIDPEMIQHTGEVLSQLLWILEKSFANPVKL